jgi:hypothetical protein
MIIHAGAGPIKMQDMQDFQQQPNQTSNMQDVAGAPDSQIGQSKSQISGSFNM